MSVLKVKDTLGNWIPIRTIIGSTPHLTIGTVTDGDTASATITGTDENPVLNLVIPGITAEEQEQLIEDILEEIDAGTIGYDDSETYDSGTVGNEIGNLKTIIDDLLVPDVSANLFDKATAISGYRISPNDVSAEGISTGDVVANSSSCIAYVPINGIGDYTWWNAYDVVGSYYSNAVLLYDESKNFISKFTGTNDSGNSKITHFTVSQAHLDSGAKYFGYTVHNNYIDTAMIVKSSTYPAEYIPYYDNGYVFNGNVAVANIIGLDDYIDDEIEPIETDLDTVKNKLNNGITPEDTTFIEHTEGSQNLFDKTKVESGYYFELNGADVGSKTASSNNLIAYVPISEPGDYSYLNALNTYGSYKAKFVILFNASKVYLSSITGTLDANDNNITHFSVSQSDITNGAKYIGYTVRTDNIDQAMVVKSATYPSQYEPYSEPGYELSGDIKVTEESLPTGGISNPLYGKSVVFDGDSICHAPSTGGWAKWIGDANSMNYHNVGVSGGTITAETYANGVARHWVSRYIDTIHTTYQTIDYLILEGGTNDADVLTDDQIGTLDYANWTTFDDTTYIGALEKLFYKALNYYPSIKIGFIVAHKMGTWANAGYDAGDSPSNRRRRKFFEIAIQVCEKWGIPYIDLWTGSPLCPKLPCYYDSSMTSEQNEAAGHAYFDGQHLTQVGYDIISPKIEAWMKTL